MTHTQAVTPELLACPNPWCDCPDSLFVQPLEKATLYSVQCMCGFEGPVLDDEQRAITAWNTRLASASAPAVDWEAVARAAYNQGYRNGSEDHDGEPDMECAIDGFYDWLAGRREFSINAMLTTAPQPPVVEGKRVEDRAREMLMELVGPHSDTALRVATDWLKQERRLALATQPEEERMREEIREAIAATLVPECNDEWKAIDDLADHIISITTKEPRDDR